MTEPTFYEVPHGAHDILRLALEQAGLPTSDLAGPNRLFFGLSDEQGIIGFVGLEGDGAERLLRSLVVMPTRRGQGYGKALVQKLEALVAPDIDRLHLLTKSAAPFFRDLGYADAERAAAPAAIARTEQFASLCPASAAYLVKPLDRSA